MRTVFFYGLFMDENLLKSNGFHPSKPILAFVEDYALKIGERATLVKSSGERAYGNIITLSDVELANLYGQTSVADYIPEEVMAMTPENHPIPAIAYNLPREKLTGRNKQYAETLVDIARDNGLPNDYVDMIATFAN